MRQTRIDWRHYARRFFQTAFGWIRTYRDVLILLIALIPVAGTWAFLELADEVVEGETQRFDQMIVSLMRNPDDPQDPIGSPWVEEMGRDLTAMGSLAFLALVTAAVAGFLLLRKQYHALVLLLVASIGGALIGELLKHLFGRERPDPIYHTVHTMSASFPSGHAMMAATVFLTLGALLSRMVKELRYRLYILSVALLATVLVGVSRIYLGVHYPTDVLAGWTAGLIWAVLCWLVAYYLQQRGAVEKPSDHS